MRRQSKGDLGKWQARKRLRQRPANLLQRRMHRRQKLRQRKPPRLPRRRNRRKQKLRRRNLPHLRPRRLSKLRQQSRSKPLQRKLLLPKRLQSLPPLTGKRLPRNPRRKSRLLQQRLPLRPLRQLSPAKPVPPRPLRRLRSQPRPRLRCKVPRRRQAWAGCGAPLQSSSSRFWPGGYLAARPEARPCKSDRVALPPVRCSCTYGRVDDPESRFPVVNHHS